MPSFAAAVSVAGLFAIYFTARAQNVGEWPPPPTELDVPYALVVTIVLVAHELGRLEPLIGRAVVVLRFYEDLSQAEQEVGVLSDEEIDALAG